MLAIEIKYKGKDIVVPVSDKLVLFNAGPLPDGSCPMNLVEYDHESGVRNVWYAGESLDPASLLHIYIIDTDNVEATEPVRREPCHCHRQLSKLERFRLIEQHLKSEGWL